MSRRGRKVPTSCRHCHKEFLVHCSYLKHGYGFFCSPQCRHEGRSQKPWAERFWPKVTKTAGCWIWTAARNRKGYGLFGKGRTVDGHCHAHRAAWIITYGPIPDGLLVLHRCDNPPCVRPDHLFLGTDLDNAHDRDTKKRNLRNGVGFNARLTPAQVREIRAAYTAGEATQTQLGHQYGVSQGAISLLLLRKTYGHID
jgi:hypothetical protein